MLKTLMNWNCILTKGTPLVRVILKKLTEVSCNDVATGLCAKSFDDEIFKECKEKVYSIDDISNACDKIIERTDYYGTHIANAIGEICSEIIEELMN